MTGGNESPSYQQGMIFLHRRDFHGARRCFEEALREARPAGEPERLMPVLGNLGNVLAALGEREEARRCYLEILELQRRALDVTTVGQTLVNLGNLSRELGERDRARAYYLEAEELLEQAGDDRSLGLLFSNFGLLEQDEGKTEDAVKSFSRAIDLHKKSGHEEGLAATWGQLGRAYLRLGDDRRAETSLNFSCTHYEQLGIPAGQIDALRLLSRLYEDRDDPELALRCLTRLEEIRLRLGPPESFQASSDDTP
ncbi:MAG TPA: tetratricopeptide repeat protein, partial [Nitrospiria bacterium]|nr:tetratricopeptide repeat protein [Nitrospiria bacterium]